MELTISIPDDVVATLRQRAASSGQPVPTYASTLVVQAVKTRSLDELLAPVHAEFARSGMSDAAFKALGQELIEKVRDQESLTVAKVAVYDTMIILQWASLPTAPDRQHATTRALVSGEVRLAMSPALLSEVRNVLLRPELQDAFPSLTPERVTQIIQAMLGYSDVFDRVPERFTLARHTKDDHLLNLAIESGATYLVTWEKRLLELTSKRSPEAEALRTLASDLHVIDPPMFAAELRAAVDASKCAWRLARADCHLSPVRKDAERSRD